jgi:hypothetical protein
VTVTTYRLGTGSETGAYLEGLGVDIRLGLGRRYKQRQDAHWAFILIGAPTIAYETLAHSIASDIFSRGDTGSEYQFGRRLAGPHYVGRPHLATSPSIKGYPFARTTNRQ